MQPAEAWTVFGRWQAERREIGIIFWGRSGNLYTLARVESARNGRLQLRGEGARASFNLVEATFTYGAMQTWPNWPSPPIVEVMAIQAQLANGDFLALAEGLRPDALPPPGEG
jgi:hypothetical protein